MLERMKKALRIGILGLFLVGLMPVAQARYGYSAKYWNTWRTGDQTTSVTSRRSKRSTPRYRTRRSTRSYWTRSRSTRRSQPMIRRSSASESVSSLRLKALPHKNKALLTVDETVIPLFHLGMSESSSSTRGTYSPATLLNKLHFTARDLSKKIDDFSDYQLVVLDKAFDFEKNGNLSIQLNNFRLSARQTSQLDISLRVKDPDLIPHEDRSLRITLKGAEARTEINQTRVPVRLWGNRIARVDWRPTPTTSGESQASGFAPSNFGGMVMAGNRFEALTLNIEAQYDDLLIDRIVLENQLGTTGIDTLVSRAYVRDGGGTLLSQSRFLGGEATFYFSSPLRVNRNETEKLRFEIQLADRFPATLSDRRFKLSVSPSGIITRGIGSGSTVPDDYKSLSLTTYDYVVVGSKLALSEGARVSGLIASGQKEPVYRLNLTNTGRKMVSLAQLAMEVDFHGLQAAGGSLSVDDVSLVLKRGNQYLDSVFTPLVLGDQIVFQASDPLQIYPGTTQLELQIALEDTGTTRDEDALSVRLLSDSSFVSDSLSTLQSGSSNFIWSDTTYRSSNPQWMSGYRVKGLGKSGYVRRYGN